MSACGNGPAAWTPACFDVTEEQRRHLHLGAVLMGNLTAADRTVQEHLNTPALMPTSSVSSLAEASLNVALQSQALDTVTGPAARNDRRSRPNVNSSKEPTPTSSTFTTG